MKKIVLMLTAILVLLGTFTPSVFAEKVSFRVFVHGEELDARGVLENNTTLVPFKSILKALDYKIEYDAKKKMVRGSKPGSIITLYINNKKTYVNGEPVTLLVAPKLIDNTTYIPLRFVSEASGESVIPDTRNKVIFIGEVVEVSPLPFRNTSWGMTQEQVRKLESAEFLQSDDDGNLLIYSGSLDGLKAHIYYHFVDNQLVNGSYVFSRNLLEIELYTSDFDKIGSYIRENYGYSVVSDIEYWKIDDEVTSWWKDQPRSKWWLPIGTGRLTLMKTWETSETTITLYLTGKDNSITHMLLYTSKELEHLDDASSGAEV